MNKILAFLEKHVQWIALGLGGLYLGYMIFTYAVQTPVLEPGIASTPLTPGEVGGVFDPGVEFRAVCGWIPGGRRLRRTCRQD